MRNFDGNIAAASDSESESDENDVFDEEATEVGQEITTDIAPDVMEGYLPYPHNNEEGGCVQHIEGTPISASTDENNNPKSQHPDAKTGNSPPVIQGTTIIGLESGRGRDRGRGFGRNRGRIGAIPLVRGGDEEEIAVEVEVAKEQVQLRLHLVGVDEKEAERGGEAAVVGQMNLFPVRTSGQIVQ